MPTEMELQANRMMMRAGSLTLRAQRMLAEAEEERQAARRIRAAVSRRPAWRPGDAARADGAMPEAAERTLVAKRERDLDADNPLREMLASWQDATSEAAATLGSLASKPTPDSPRWCDECQRFGDHHTDRHPATPHELPRDLNLPGIEQRMFTVRFTKHAENVTWLSGNSFDSAPQAREYARDAVAGTPTSFMVVANPDRERRATSPEPRHSTRTGCRCKPCEDERAARMDRETGAAVLLDTAESVQADREDRDTIIERGDGKPGVDPDEREVLEALGAVNRALRRGASYVARGGMMPPSVHAEHMRLAEDKDALLAELERIRGQA